MNILYIVELSEEERTRLHEMTGGGHARVRRVKRAQILLASEQGHGDAAVASLVGVGTSTVYRTKRRFVEGGMEVALSEGPRVGAKRMLTGREETLLVAVACSDPPAGRARWTLQLLAGEMVQRTEHQLADGVRRLTSHPADLYGIPDRGRIAPGAWADLLLFDPDTVGVTASERVADLPGGGRRTIRRPIGVHGVFCNGVEVFDGTDYVTNGRGPGQVLDRFTPSSALGRGNGSAAGG